MTSEAQTSQAVVKRSAQFSDDQLRELSFADLAALASNGDMATVDVSEFGTGFTILDDKARLVGVRFVIVDWRFSVGTYGSMVTLLVMTANNEKWIVNDGSTGIHDQMQKIDAKVGGIPTLIACPRGLTRSDYTYRDEKGNDIPATTFYLSFERATQ